MKIIEATNQHSNVIIKKVTELIKELGGKAFMYNHAEVLGFVNDAMAKGKYVAFLAIDESEKVVGVLTMGESGAVYAGGKFGIIHEFYVNPGMRSCGIGKSLLEKAKQKSITLNWCRLEVGAPPLPAWKRTKDFYEAEEFQEIGPRLKWLAEPTHPDGPRRCRGR